MKQKSPFILVSWPNGRYPRPAVRPSNSAKMRRLGIKPGIDFLLRGYVDRVRAKI
jgi:hypothetical protein